MSNNHAGWFDHVGPGWRPLLQELDAELSAKWPNYRIAQVKEKFGTLRVYASPYPGPSWEGWAEFDAVIRKYEKRSSEICEECGAAGKLRDTRWVKTRCDVCQLVHENRGLSGYHADQWNRFVVSAPSFDEAARVAGRLGWWLHCWSWQEGPWVIKDTSIRLDMEEETDDTAI